MPAFAVAADRSDAQDAGDYAPGIAPAPVPFWDAVGQSFDNGLNVQRLGAREDALQTALRGRDDQIRQATGQLVPGSEGSFDNRTGEASGAFDTPGYETGVESLRAKYPAQMAGVQTGDQVRAGVDARLTAIASRAQVSADQHPFGAFLGGAGSQLADPLNLGVGAVTGGAGEGLPLVTRMLLQSGVWGSLAAAEAPAKAYEAHSVGGPAYTLQDALGDVGGGLVAGPLFEGGGFLLKKLGSAAFDRFAPLLSKAFAGDDAARGALDAGGVLSRDAAAIGPQRSGADFEAAQQSLIDGTPPPSIEPGRDLGDLFGPTTPPPGPARGSTPIFADSPAGSALYKAAEYRGRQIYTGAFDPATLRTDPATFQYKSDADAQGVTDRLKGVQAWDPTSSGKIIAYDDGSGLTIADGHQRLALANRMAAAGFEPRLDGYLFRAADGWTPLDVRVIAALKNIREGQGTPLDAAKVFRDAPGAINDDSLPVSGDFIKQAKGLARLSHDAFGAVVNKVVPERYAAMIGELAGTRPDLHESMIKLLKAGDPANLDEAHALIHEALEDDWIKGEGAQSDLFGDTDVQSLAISRAKLKASLIGSLRRDSGLFGQLVRHADAIEAGGNTLARDANEAELAANNAALEIISKLGMRSGDLGDAMTAAAGDITRGAKVSEAAKPILARIKNALANGARIDGERAGLLEPAAPLRGSEDAVAKFSDVGGKGQEAQAVAKPEDAEVEKPAALARPEPAAGVAPFVHKGDLWRLSEPELQDLLEKTRLDEKTAMERALGSPERAKRFDQLDRARNSTMNPARADKASADFDREFGDLTPAQERLIYGYRDDPTPSAEDIKEVLQAHQDVFEDDTVELAARQAAYAVQGSSVADLRAAAGGEGSARAQRNLVRLSMARQVMSDRGIPADQIPGRMARSMVETGTASRAQAEELIGYFFEQAKKAGRGEDAGVGGDAPPAAALALPDARGTGLPEPAEPLPGVRRFGIPPEAAPAITSFDKTKPLTSHPSYKAAKAGDVEAAARVVADLVDERQVSEARARFGPDAIYTPVLAEEEAGRNKIPLMLARRYAGPDGRVNTDIIQTNRAFHTGADGLQRFVSRATFDGPVEAGGRYVLVDDVSTMGGTLAELSNHIRENGGEVDGVTTLADLGRHAQYEPLPKHLDALEKKYGPQIRDELGIEPGALTADEARFLAGLRNPERFGASVAAARDERITRLRQRGVEPDTERAGEPAGLTAPEQAALREDAARFAGAGEDPHPGLFDDIRGPTDEEAAFEHLKSCAPGA